MKHFVFALVAASIAAGLATPAASEENTCGKREDIVARLESGYQEFNSAMGMSTNGGLVELFTSRKGTWTLMLTQPDGISCLIAAGDNWESFSGGAKNASQVF